MCRQLKMMRIAQDEWRIVPLLQATRPNCGTPSLSRCVPMSTSLGSTRCSVGMALFMGPTYQVVAHISFLVFPGNMATPQIVSHTSSCSKAATLTLVVSHIYMCCLFFCCCIFDVASFFVCLVLIEYVVCSVLTEHVQHFEPQVGCSQRDSAL